MIWRRGEKVYNKDRKVKYYHVHWRNRVTTMFSSGNSKDITTSYSHKNIHWRHWFYPKVNLVHNDGTQTAGYVIDNSNDILSVEITDDNDNIIAINTPALRWNIELRDYEHEDVF